MNYKYDLSDKNYWFPVGTSLNPNEAAETFNVAANVDTSKKAVTRNLSNFIAPVQLQRLRHDVKLWRDCTTEAELAYYPHRIRMQRLYLDTEQNGHVFACWQRRKDLTRLRKYEFYTGDRKNAVVNEELTEWFGSQMWFDEYVDYVLDALAYGYSLISLDDIEEDNFKGVHLVRRWNISPDRYQVTNMVYALTGLDWREEPLSDWHVYVSTPNSSGASPCGYGFFYNVALYEIFLRSILGYNGDFVELYAQPYRVGKTLKTTEAERAQLTAAIQNMGSNGWAIIDPSDDIQFLETALGGTGWKGYDNFETRLNKLISKIILGHADAMDSIPGKLGNDDGESPAQNALEDKQTKDGKFVENSVIMQLLPRMINLGMKPGGLQIPDGTKFRYKNDAEISETMHRENAENVVVSTIALNMKNAGLQMDAEYFAERTGIKAEKVEAVPIPVPGKPEDDKQTKKPGISEKTKARLKRIYEVHG